jgi:hypothetical protein
MIVLSLMRKKLLIIRSRCEIAKHIINSGFCGRINNGDSHSKLLVFDFFSKFTKRPGEIKINWQLVTAKKRII